MKQLCLCFVLFSLVLYVFGSPLPGSKEGKYEKEKVLFDQRQEGEWNIRADLKNFVILIVPKNSALEETTTGSNLSLLDFFRSHSKHHGNRAKYAPRQPHVDVNEEGAETKHFIESKTAPYHVDISRSDGHLLNDEILATQTPPVALALKTNEESSKTSEDQDKSKTALLRQLRSTRFSKAFVLTVPEEEFVLTKMEADKKVVKKDGLKKKSKKKNKDEMTLLGAAEQCGPEMYRDADGVCRLKRLRDVASSSELMERDE